MASATSPHGSRFVNFQLSVAHRLKQLGELQAHLSEIRQLDGEVLALTSAGNLQDARLTRQTLSLTFPILPGPASVQKVADDYGVLMPQRNIAIATVVVDKTGIVRFAHRAVFGDDNRPKLADILATLRTIKEAEAKGGAVPADPQAVLGAWHGTIDETEAPLRGKDGPERALVVESLNQQDGQWVGVVRYGRTPEHATPIPVVRVGVAESVTLLFDTQAGSRIRLALAPDRKTLSGTFAARGDILRKITFIKAEP